jgi:putative DNA primase/helicase
MPDGTSNLDLAAAVARLAVLSPLEYDRCRIAEAEALGVRAATLDSEVATARRGTDGQDVPGRRVQLPEAEPRPEPVDLAETLTAIASAVRRHVIFSAEAADAVALWAAHTWGYDRFRHTPRLAITSPTKRCGKSTLLAILLILCRRPLKTDSISASGVFRVVEALHPLTLLLDEVDAFAQDNEELRGVLNSGFEASGAVIRVVERDGQHEPVQFSTFAPLVLAAIGTIPGTLADRAVPIRMERKPAADTVERLRDNGSAAGLTVLARKLARWTADNAARLSPAPGIPGAMNDREGDISVPLLALADAAGADWPARARKALLHLFGLRSDADEGTEAGVLLLGDLKALFAETGAERLPSATICTKLGEMDSRPWPEWKNGKPITPMQLARVLAPFRVTPQTYKPKGGDKAVKGYIKDHFSEAWRRYLAADTPSQPKEGGSSRNPVTDGGNPPFFEESRAVTPESGYGSPIAKKPQKSAAGYGVTAQNPPLKPEGVAADGSAHWEGVL